MSITRDQLRAARVLLHLQQMQLADLSRVSVSTIRRFEAGTDIGHLHADALRRTLVDAGVVFVDSATDGTLDLPSGVVGVVLRPPDDLPAATRARIAAPAAPAESRKTGKPSAPSDASAAAMSSQGGAGTNPVETAAEANVAVVDPGGDGTTAKAPGGRRQGKKGGWRPSRGRHEP